MAPEEPERSQSDARRYDAKMKEPQVDGEEFFTCYDEVYGSFYDMNLRENLLRGIYAYGFKKPSSSRQRESVLFHEEHDVFQETSSENSKHVMNGYPESKRPRRSHRGANYRASNRRGSSNFKTRH